MRIIVAAFAALIAVATAAQAQVIPDPVRYAFLREAPVPGEILRKPANLIQVPPPAGGGAYTGPGDVSGGNNIALYYGTAAMSAAEAATTPAVYDYSCATGSPATGTVNLLTTGYADQSIFTGACNGLTVLVTNIYARTQTSATCGGTLAGCNLTAGVSNGISSQPWSGIRVVANLTNSHSCFQFVSATDQTYIRAASSYVQAGQPQGMSLVVSQSVATAGSVFFSANSSGFNPMLVTRGAGGLTSEAGTTLTPSPTAPVNGTFFAFNAGFSGNPSNNKWRTTATSGSARGNAGTGTGTGTPVLGQFSTALIGTNNICESILFDNNTAWNDATFATTEAAVGANQVSRWGL